MNKKDVYNLIKEYGTDTMGGMHKLELRCNSKGEVFIGPTVAFWFKVENRKK